jgi:hypothetical protein
MQKYNYKSLYCVGSNQSDSKTSKGYTFFVQFILKDFLSGQSKNGFVQDAITSTMLSTNNLEFSSNQLTKKYKVTNETSNTNLNSSQTSSSKKSSNMKYKFDVVDFKADENIQTKIAGTEFKLDISVAGSKNSDLEYFRYKNSIRWNDAKRLCENNGWKIASKTDLAKIKNIPRSEYWTDKESGSYAYMFRPPNWTQRMQKNNYKKLYCVSDPNQYKTTNSKNHHNHPLNTLKWSHDFR